MRNESKYSLLQPRGDSETFYQQFLLLIIVTVKQPFVLAIFQQRFERVRWQGFIGMSDDGGDCEHLDGVERFREILISRTTIRFRSRQQA